MTGSDEAISSIERSVLEMRRRQRRATLAGNASVAEMRRAEVVDVIVSRSGATTVADVARELSIDPSQASRRVADAVDARLVRRAASQLDGRVSILEVTPAGERVITRIRDRRYDLVDRAMQSWTPADRSKLAELLERFVNHLDADPPPTQTGPAGR